MCACTPHSPCLCERQLGGQMELGDPQHQPTALLTLAASPEAKQALQGCSQPPCQPLPPITFMA